MYSNIAIDNVARILGYNLRPWQIELMRHILDNPRTIVQGARQVTGKTFSLAFLAALFLLDGKSVIIGMPNMRSAESILFKAILKNVNRLEELGLLEAVLNRVTEKEFNNGASIRALTASKASVKEGYSDVYFVILDEGQKILDPEVIAIFDPFLTNADLQQQGRLAITGIGGPRESLITQARLKLNSNKKEIFKRKVISASYIRTITDEYNSFFEDKLNSLGSLLYDVHYECNDLTEGSHYLFGTFPDAIPLPNYAKTHIFGIDVGGTSEEADWTCVVAIECCEGLYNIIDCQRIKNVKAMKEAELISQFINKYPRKMGGVGVETNGIGHKFRDILYEDCGLRDIGSIHMNYDKKWYLTNTFERLVREGRMGCSVKEVKDELQLMTIQIDKNGKYIWRHSDIFSACLIALTRIGEPETIL